MKLLFVSLGCDKNLVDTEFMLGMLRDDGIEITNDETEADIIIVNTCCFINDAKEESVNTILEMAGIALYKTYCFLYDKRGGEFLAFSILACSSSGLA